MIFSYSFLKVWWHEATLYYYYTFIQIHSYTFMHTVTFAEFRSSFFIAASSGRGPPVSTGMPSRDSNSGPPYSSPTRYQLSHAAPLLSHAAPY
jgi:hypothetical protein